MLTQSDWDERYATGDIPWDVGEPSEHLVELVQSRIIPGGRALDVGCGTGTNALWLAGQGFDVLGIDLSPLAIEKAQAKLDASDRNCRFATLDFLNESVVGGPFDLVFDLGCFHVFDEAEDRSRFAGRVADVLEQNGVWLSLIGSTEGPERDHGPPRRSLRDVANAVEPNLHILEIRSVGLRPEMVETVSAWRCISRRRDVPAQPSTRR